MGREEGTKVRTQVRTEGDGLMDSAAEAHTCPLCKERRTAAYHEDRRRRYRVCGSCNLVFVPPQYHLPAEAEKAEYDLHENSPNDPGYRRFLSRAFLPVQARLKPGSVGLDFGAGPGPVLSLMFQEAGHRMFIYDPFYAPDTSVFERRYDFITATEVVEHLQRPQEELDRLWACLKPGGLLGVMTKRVFDRERFARWHYKEDRTHVAFFSLSTFAWLAARWHAHLIVVDRDVVMLEK